MKKEYRVKPTLSKTQWDRIDTALTPVRIEDYIKNELSRIDMICNDIDGIKECENCQQERKISLGTASWAAIERIKQKTGIKDPATIISRFILTPLLISKD